MQSKSEGPFGRFSLHSLSEGFLLSPTIHEAFRNAALYTPDGRIGIQGFLCAAANVSGGNAATVLRNVLPKAAYLKRGLSLGISRQPDLVQITPGLWEAFKEARDLRLAGKGKDEFLGLRHVLFSIFTSERKAIQTETIEFLSEYKIERASAGHAIASYLVGAIEPQEDPHYWAAMLRGRGFRELANKLYDQDDAAKLDESPKIVVCRPDDPWDSKLRDHFGVEQEANAFADMVTARNFSPPLAVGIFGEWGSGKSFFLRMVGQAIRARTEAAQKNQDTASDDPHLRHVVQIRFNAWHFAETNLWASLIDHIFTCLDQWTHSNKSAGKAEKLFESLATARLLTLESADALVARRREQKAAEMQHAEAQQALAMARAKADFSPMTAAKALWDSFRKQHQSEIDRLADASGLPQLKNSAAEFQDVTRQLENELGGAGLVRSLLLRRLGSERGVWCLLGAIVLLSPGLAMLLSEISEKVFNQAQSVAAGMAGAIAGLIAPLALALTRATRFATGTLDELRKLRTTYTEQIESSLNNERQKEDEAIKQLAQAQARAEEAADRLRLATEQVVEAAREHNSETGRGRVLRFVRDRVADGTYAKHLSFVATVRKDFEQLSELMAPQSKEAEAATARARKEYEDKLRKFIDGAGGLLKDSEREVLEELAKPPQDLHAFERIVLYIDDLDRCPPQKVVQVLQAIHLLLTFPLFVVFVAVDVRWLQQALLSHYEGQFEIGVKSEVTRGIQKPAASDYLEKIFQIPYWVRPTTPEKVWSMLEDRLASEEVSHAQGGGFEARVPAITDSDEETSDEDLSEIEILPSIPAPPPLARTQMLIVGSAERDFLKVLSPRIEESPRRLLRFVNTYHLIKGSLSPKERRDLEKGGFRILMTLLAISIVAEQVFASAAGALLQASMDLPNLKLAIQNSANSPTDIRRAQRILELLVDDDYNQPSWKALVMLVSRYGFIHHLE